MKFDAVVDGLGFLEAPARDGRGGVYFADASRGGVWEWAPGKPLTAVVAHRRGIGGLAPHASGGLVVTGRNVAWKAADPSDGSGTRILLAADPAARVFGFNDLDVDARGRIFVGSLGGPPATTERQLATAAAGRIHRIDADGRSTVVIDDVQYPNGIGICASQQHMFVVDSGRRALLRFELAPDGSAHEGHVIHDAAEGIPDGIALTLSGEVLLAMHGAGRLVVLDHEGVILDIVATGRRAVTSLCFGEPDFRALFLTCGPEDGCAAGGALLATTWPSAGLPAAAASTYLGPGQPAPCPLPETRGHLVASEPASQLIRLTPP